MGHRKQHINALTRLALNYFNALILNNRIYTTIGR